MENSNTRQFKCRDMDMNCDWQVEGSNDDQIMNKIEEHARDKHSDISMTEQVRNKVRSVIRDFRRSDAA